MMDDIEWVWFLLAWVLVGLCFAAGWGLHAIMSSNGPPADGVDSTFGA